MWRGYWCYLERMRGDRGQGHCHPCFVKGLHNEPPESGRGRAGIILVFGSNYTHVIPGDTGGIIKFGHNLYTRAFQIGGIKYSYCCSKLVSKCGFCFQHKFKDFRNSHNKTIFSLLKWDKIISTQLDRLQRCRMRLPWKLPGLRKFA